MYIHRRHGMSDPRVVLGPAPMQRDPRYPPGQSSIYGAPAGSVQRFDQSQSPVNAGGVPVRSLTRLGDPTLPTTPPITDPNAGGAVTMPSLDDLKKVAYQQSLNQINGLAISDDCKAKAKSILDKQIAGQTPAIDEVGFMTALAAGQIPDGCQPSSGFQPFAGVGDFGTSADGAFRVMGTPIVSALLWLVIGGTIVYVAKA